LIRSNRYILFEINCNKLHRGSPGSLFYRLLLRCCCSHGYCGAAVAPVAASSVADPPLAAAPVAAAPAAATSSEAPPVAADPLATAARLLPHGCFFRDCLLWLLLLWRLLPSLQHPEEQTQPTISLVCPSYILCYSMLTPIVCGK
jgi:hypothetical protein